ncbi:hypothetical protein HYC85_018024 [Camellia sinensis]|uniref:Uncharacterized protein n=1 Tax=Camellia sinensis TaxID=4442 RepID=A0A7J7GU12_CAMSI|nr:hypothetical protein HYC85_018024 [Camellia sinensis]
MSLGRPQSFKLTTSNHLGSINTLSILLHLSFASELHQMSFTTPNFLKRLNKPLGFNELGYSIIENFHVQTITFHISNQGDRINMNNQLLNHQTIVSRIATLLGGEEVTANYLSKCIYSIGMGSNDYINNYLSSEYYPTSRLYTPKQYASALIEEYSQQLRVGIFFEMTLYKLGEKKMAIFALGLIG